MPHSWSSGRKPTRSAVNRVARATVGSWPMACSNLIQLLGPFPHHPRGRSPWRVSYLYAAASPVGISRPCPLQTPRKERTGGLSSFKDGILSVHAPRVPFSRGMRRVGVSFKKASLLSGGDPSSDSGGARLGQGGMVPPKKNANLFFQTCVFPSG